MTYLARRHHLARVDNLATGHYADGGSQAMPVESWDEANIITSQVMDQTDPVSGMPTHTVMLDIDIPAQLIASSTPGHSHLFIDKVMTWDQYEALLIALRDAGIIEAGFCNASIQRGFSSLRLPWVTKDDPDDEPRTVVGVDGNTMVTGTVLNGTLTITNVNFTDELLDVVSGYQDGT